MPSDAAPLTPTAPQRKRLDGPLYKGFVLAVTKAAYPHLKAAGGGSIINTGSVAGRFGGT